MSNLVDQDVSDKFSGRGFQRIVHQTEILWDIPVLSGIAFPFKSARLCPPN